MELTKTARWPLRRWLPCLAALLLSGPQSAGAIGCPEPQETEVIRLINQERARLGIPLLAADVRIVEAAQRHSDDMAANGFVSHTGSDGSNFAVRMRDAGYPAPATETVGAGQGSASDVVSAWLASDSHRPALLSSMLTHVGVGFSTSDLSYGTFWTADFGWDDAPAWSPADHCAAGGGEPSPGDPAGGEEAPAPGACEDGLDNDGDGLADHPDDPGCASPGDDSEQQADLACDDGVDNDADGSADTADVGCRHAGWSREDPACSDGLDNDGDGSVDWLGGPRGEPADRQCASRPWQDSEGKRRKAR